MIAYAVLYILFIASISLGAASAFFCDIFFSISVRDRRIKVRESNRLRGFSGISALSSIVAIIALVCLMSIRISDGITPGESILAVLTVLLVVTFTCSFVMRNIHLVALKRHHNEYHHLSESFASHQDALLKTTTISVVSWIYIITIASADARDLIVSSHFWTLIISYAVIAYVLSNVVVYAKKKIS